MLTKKIRFIHLAASYIRRALKDCETLSGTFACCLFLGHPPNHPPFRFAS